MATREGKKTGGRKRGTPNKATMALLETLEEKKIHPITGLKKCLVDLGKLKSNDPDTKINIIKARASIYIDLMQYIYPKRKAIEMNNDTPLDSGPQIVEIKWADEESNVDISPQDEAKNTPTDSNQSKPETV